MATKKFITSELREDCGAVFLSEYPQDGDLKEWLAIHRDKDPLGIFTSHWHDKAIQRIEELEQEVLMLRKVLRHG